MKTASAALINLLNSGVPLIIADLYTITLVDATVLRWTGYDQNLTVGTTTWNTSGATVPVVKRGAIRCSRGLEVGTLSITLETGEAVTLYGIPMQLAAHNGAFDGARVKVERAYMSSPGDTTPGTIVLFEGNVAAWTPRARPWTSR